MDIKVERLSPTDVLTLIKRRVSSGDILTLCLNRSSCIIKNYKLEEKPQAEIDFDAYVKSNKKPALL